MLTEYPNRVPVIVEPLHLHATAAGGAESSRYMLPKDATVGRVVRALRRQTNKTDKTLFIFVSDGVLPPTTESMSDLYRRFKDDDGLLYIFYAEESTV